MKKLLLIVSIAFITLNSEGKITSPEELSSLCKIWGFLKYHHPNVASGKFDWDKELFKQLETSSESDFNERMINWIQGLGEIKITNNENKSNINKALDWLKQDDLINDSLENLLWYIYNNRQQGKQYYVKPFFANGTILFKNENPYQQIDFSDEKIRLLAVFRYWNAINYFYPYTTLVDTNWNLVLTLAIEKMKCSNTRTTYLQTMRWMTQQTCDGHNYISVFYTIPRDSLRWTPTTYQIYENRIFVNGFNTPVLAKTIPLKIGDEIVSINGESVQLMIDYWRAFLSGSNESGRNNNISYFALSGQTDSVNIIAKRQDSLFAFTTKRYGEKELLALQNGLNSLKDSIINGIPYLSLENASNKEIESFMIKHMNSSVLIFDLRNYPKGDPKEILSKYLTNDPKKFAEVRLMDIDNPGLTRRMKKDSTKWDYSWIGKKNKQKLYTGKAFLLVDVNSISHAEFTAMALQTMPQITVIGSQTAGANGNVTSLILPGYIKTYFSGLGVWYPDGSQGQRKGVKLDIEVKATLEGIINGKDEILEKAIEYANTLK